MKINIAVADDDAADREKLKSHLEKFFSLRSGIAAKIDMYDSGEKLMEKFTPKAYDIVFLDIYMKEKSGIDTAKQIKVISPDQLFVFITSSNEHFSEAFEFHAFDYLVKPYDADRIEKTCADALLRFIKPKNYITLRVARDTFEIEPENIVKAIANDHQVEVTAANGRTINVIMNFSEITQLLCADAQFMCCNRGIIINMRYIKSIVGNSITLKDGSFYPMRIRERTALINQFNKFTFDNIKELNRK